jgi:hypothetical protein
MNPLYRRRPRCGIVVAMPKRRRLVRAAAVLVGLISVAGLAGPPALAEPAKPARPAETKPTETKPAEPKPAEPKPAETRPDDKAAPRTTVSGAEAQRFYGFFERVAAIVVANQADCKAMAAALNAHTAANQAVIKAAAEAKRQNRELPAQIKDKIVKKYASDVAPALAKKCGSDSTVIDALVRMHPPTAHDRPESEREH